MRSTACVQMESIGSCKCEVRVQNVVVRRAARTHGSSTRLCAFVRRRRLHRNVLSTHLRPANAASQTSPTQRDIHPPPNPVVEAEVDDELGKDSELVASMPPIFSKSELMYEMRMLSQCPFCSKSFG